MNKKSSVAEKLPLSIIIRLYIPFALGYFISQHFRTVNAIISTDLVQDTGIDALQLGAVTGVYFLAFALAQLPMGILLDKIGPRRTDAALLLFAALGAVLFGSGANLEQLLVGRLLIGLGVSCCLMAAFKAFVLWLPAHQLPFANGCVMAAGSLGILASTIPIEAALQIVDWRTVYFGLAAITLLISTLVFFVVPEKEVAAIKESFSEQIAGLLKIYKSRYFWRVVPFAIAVEGGVIGFFTLWTVPWLRDVAGFDREQTANGMFIIALAMIVGFPFFGYLASRLNKVGISTLNVTVVGMTASVVLGAVVLFRLTDYYLAAWVLFMFSATSSILVFAAMSQHFPSELSGRANTAVNFLLFLTAFASQTGIGAILNRFEVVGGSGYSLQGYDLVAKIFIGVQVLGLLWYVLFGMLTKDDSKIEKQAA